MRKKAVSAVIANMIMVSITLAIGFVFWTTVNSTAGTTLTTYTEQTAADLNQLNEGFVITLIAFDYPSVGDVTVWFYNNGGLATTLNFRFANHSTNSKNGTSAKSIRTSQGIRKSLRRLQALASLENSGPFDSHQ